MSVVEASPQPKLDYHTHFVLILAKRWACKWIPSLLTYEIEKFLDNKLKDLVFILFNLFWLNLFWIEFVRTYLLNLFWIELILNLSTELFLNLFYTQHIWTFILQKNKSKIITKFILNWTYSEFIYWTYFKLGLVHFNKFCLNLF